jgi:hypothetical protein
VPSLSKLFFFSFVVPVVFLFSFFHCTPQTYIQQIQYSTEYSYLLLLLLSHVRSALLLVSVCMSWILTTMYCTFTLSCNILIMNHIYHCLVFFLDSVLLLCCCASI